MKRLIGRRFEDAEVQKAAPDLRAALKEHPDANIAIISVPGSMGPKMSAAIKFVDGQAEGKRDRFAAITTPELVYGTLDIASQNVIEGGRGTRIIADPVVFPAPAKELA